MTLSIRYPDWPQRLHAAIDLHRRKTFRYGTHDCCLFAADLVKAMTGWDPAESMRGTYHDQLGAWRVLRNFGGEEAMLSELLGASPTRDGTPMRGDVCLLEPIGGEAMKQVGVCIGDSVIVAAEVGVLHRSPSKVICYWRLD